MSKTVQRQQQFAMKPLALAVMLAGGGSVPAMLHAATPLPTGATIAHGNVTLTNPNANTLNINQTTDKAIIDWRTFDIAKGNTVNFVQPGANASALNRIHALDVNPSQIAGTLNANGRVYLINQNGIIFKGSAQINTAGMVASTLDVNEELFKNSSIFNAINSGNAALSKNLDSMTPEQRAAYEAAEIKIENGAQLKTASGGSILIFAPNITNDGKIETPDGQTILAAAQDKVYLTVSDQDDDIRGLLVEVGIGGKVTNAELGEIIAERGNITLLGLAVNQNGRLKATTAVDLNGTIRLLARDNAQTSGSGGGGVPAIQLGFDEVDEFPTAAYYAKAIRSGTVRFGSNSKTEILPDESDADLKADGLQAKTAPNALVQNQSKIEVMGKSIVMEKDSTITAPSAEVIFTATTKPSVNVENTVSAEKDDARVYLAEGSKIDVSGTDIELDMSRNVVEVELRGNELKDSPLQRDGVLRGKKVKVDLRKGESIAIADISGAVNAIKRDVSERMTTGGSVKIRSTGDTIVAKGATIDASGGTIKYRAGLIESTKLLSNGQIVDISDADPNAIYDGIVGVNTIYHDKWGVTETFVGMNTQSSSVWVEGYTQGKNAGSIDIQSNALVLEGDIRADTVAGEFQRDVIDKASGGSLNVNLRVTPDSYQELRIVDDFNRHDIAADDLLVVASDDETESETEASPRHVLIDDDGDGIADLLVSDDLINNGGFGSVSFKMNGSAAIEQGADVQMKDGAALSITAAGIEHAGSITAHGGSVALKTDILVEQEALQTVGDTTVVTQNPLHMTGGSLIDVSGRFTNDFIVAPDALPIDAIATKAGSVSLSAKGALTLDAGSVIRADGGAQIARDGKVMAGSGGNITLESKVDDGADVTLAGELSGYSLKKGGTLSVAAASVLITGDTDTAEADGKHLLVLDDEFFRQGGFNGYKIKANMESLQVDASTNIELASQQRVLGTDGSYLTAASGTDLADITSIKVLPDYLREASSISLSASRDAKVVVPGSSNTEPGEGGLVIEDGARIATDAGGALSLKSDDSLYIGGTLQAHGGAIDARLVAGGEQVGYDATQSIWVGKQALIDVDATTETIPDAEGLRKANLLDAGSVTLWAQRGYLAVEDGAQIHASGLAATVDQRITSEAGGDVISQTIALNAGKVNLRAAEGMLIDGELSLQRADVAGARGGNLTIALDTDYSSRVAATTSPDLFPDDAPVLRIDGDATQSQLDTLTYGDELAEGQRARAVLNDDVLNRLDLDVLTLEAKNKFTGEDDYATGRVEFANGASLETAQAINLVTTNIRVNDNSLAKINSATVLLGYETTSHDIRLPITDTPVSGNGAFVVSANFIDVTGNVSVSNVEELSLASTGDIRLRSNTDATGRQYAQGTLESAGDINLLAQQIYPSTLADYRIHSTASDGRITVAKADGDAQTPLSAAGRLTLQASEIEQGGVIRAPLGEIVIGDEQTESVTLAADSITSVSADGNQIPLGRIQGEDVVWNYGLNTAEPLIINDSSLPDKNVRLQAGSVDIQQGATLDISGNGDIYATEFVPGPGGSKDVLDGANAGNSFAIVPTLQNGYAPYDAVEARGTSIELGSTLRIENAVTLSNGQILSPGEYTILPARYALQPDAILVTPVSTTNVMQPDQTLTRADNTQVVAGKRGVANTEIEDSTWSAFAFEPGSVALKRSEYVRKTSTEFFTAEKALYSAAGDAGRVSIIAGESMNLDGELVATHAAGARGSRIDIAATNLLVTTDGTAADAADDEVVLSASDINAFGAESVLLGGERTRLVDGDEANDNVTSTRSGINVVSGNVRIADDTVLDGSEFVLTGRHAVTVGQNASITAQAEKTSTATQQYLIDGDGALLQVSALDDALVQRSNELGNTGDVTLGENTRLTAAQSVVLDASNNIAMADAVISSRALTLSTQRIVLGDADADTSGTILSEALLNALDLENLTLFSRSDISIASDVNIEAANLTLRAGNIVANDNSAHFTTTNTLTLEGNAQSAAANASTGTLVFDANFVRLGDAAQTQVADASLQLDANAVSINAGSGLLLSDALALHSSNDLTITAAQVTAIDAADISIDATGKLALTNGGTQNALLLAVAAVGARLDLQGTEVALDTQVRLPSGVIKATATQADITLGQSARLDVSGSKQTFDTETVASAGGDIALVATQGDVLADAASVMNFSGAFVDADHSARGGSLAVTAAQGDVTLNGTLRGDASTKAEAGSISVDGRTLGDVDALAAQLQSGGVSGAIMLRQREGDITIAQTTTITAHEISLAADGGDVIVAGTLNADGDKGGKIDIATSGDAVLEATAKLEAFATSDDGRGGRISIGSVNGVLDLKEGSVIDVHGGDDSAANNGRNTVQQGQVHLRARRSETHEVAVADFDTQVTGAEKITLEAFDDSINATVVNASVMGTVEENIEAFMAHADDVLSALGNLAQNPQFRLLPGIEIQSDGDMQVSDEIDFAEWRYTSGEHNVPGVLTLRAAGNLDIDTSINDGFVYDLTELGAWTPDVKILKADESWSYNFVAGADFGAATLGVSNAETFDANTGAALEKSLTVGANTTIRTGTGDIRVAAGGDVTLVDTTSVIYTAGKTSYYEYTTDQILLDTTYFVGSTIYAPYAGSLHPYFVDNAGAGVIPDRVVYPWRGGDISIEARSSVTLAKSNQISSDWLQRFAGESSIVFDAQNRVDFNLATSGIVAADFAQGIATLGGGDIVVRAGQDITNLSVSAPVTYRQNLVADIAANSVPLTGDIVATNGIYAWERNGGGDVSVIAGRDILSAHVLADKGNATLIAGRDIRAGNAENDNAAMVSLSDASVNLQARNDVVIDAIYNTSMVAQSYLQGQADTLLGFFFAYGDDASASIQSTAGNITFENNPSFSQYVNSFLRSPTEDAAAARDLLRVMPQTLQAEAFAGNINIDGNMALFPNTEGQLELLAEGDITTQKSGTTNIAVYLSDADPALMPSLSNTLDVFSYPQFYLNYFNITQEGLMLPSMHAATPVHLDDARSVKIIAAEGSIDGKSNLQFFTPKKTYLSAGEDVTNLVLKIQNVNASDTSVIKAGDDIAFNYVFNENGTLAGDTNVIEIAGPGRLDVLAGDEIRLGASNGIVSVGDQNNPALADTGADITLLAGLTSAPDNAAVIAKYLSFIDASTGDVTLIDLAKTDAEKLKQVFDDPAQYGVEFDDSITVSSTEQALQAYAALDQHDQLLVALALYDADDHDYTAGLLSFVLSERFAGDAVAMAAQITGQPLATQDDLVALVAQQNVRDNNALAQSLFKRLGVDDQRGFLLSVVYDEVRKGGIESLTENVVNPETDGFARSYAAIETFLPFVDQNDANLVSDKGDISLVFSQVKTLDGGSVNFMTPQGSVDVGLAGSFAGFNKASSELGLQAQGVGDINGVTYDDININASRIFALDGGDITLWSSQRDIDAGKGAKTALSLPPPVVKVDKDGNPFLEFSPAVSGSGIQAAVYTADRAPGDVYLFAPQGVIDAGDAGISSAGNLFLAATKVLGADNISFGGVAIGVPTSTGISSSLSAAADAATASTTGATDNVSEKSSKQCDGDDEDCEDNNAVAFVTVEIIGLGD